MFRIFGAAAATLAAIKAAPYVAEKCKTGQPSDKLKNAADRTAERLAADGLAQADVTHYQAGQYMSGFAMTATSPDAASGDAACKRVTRATLFDRVDITHASSDDSTSLDVTYRR